MKLIIILIVIMSTILLIGFIIIFFLKLRKKKSKSRKIKYRSYNKNSYNSNITNVRQFKENNNNFEKNKKVIEMLTYLQEIDIANYNNIVPKFYNILEKPIDFNLHNDKSVNYLLTNVVDILCHHHHCITNPLHLIKHLLNKCSDELHYHQKNGHLSHDHGHVVKTTHVFNKIQTNDATSKNNLPALKHKNHTL